MSQQELLESTEKAVSISKLLLELKTSADKNFETKKLWRTFQLEIFKNSLVSIQLTSEPMFACILKVCLLEIVSLHVFFRLEK